MSVTRVQPVTPTSRPFLAAIIGAPIGFVGGLIGLGGSEFRLPFLVGVFDYSTRAAVPLNLAVSLITVGAGLVTKAWRGPLDVSPLLGLIATMIAGGLVGAYIGAASVVRVSEYRLRRLVEVLLVVVGIGMIAEAVFGWEGRVVFHSPTLALAAAAVLGLVFGALRSLLGIAGGEVVIPALVLLFGVGIKAAGTASQIISLPTVALGLWRYQRSELLGAREDWQSTVLPMGGASVVGAIIGSALVALVPGEALKIALGITLVGSAVKVFR
jgi:uncharacterized membrane protein YfcA